MAALAGELAGIDGDLTRTRLLRCAATLTGRLPRRISDEFGRSRQVVAD